MTKDEYKNINVERKDGGFRWYRVSGGEWVPSVTTIARNVLNYPRIRLCRDTRPYL